MAIQEMLNVLSKTIFSKAFFLKTKKNICLTLKKTTTLPVQAAGAGDRVLGCIRPVGRRTKRNQTKWNEARTNERNEKNETRRIFRIAEVACDLQSLDAFFLFTFGRHFGVLARLQKNVHSAERALLRFIFFLRKIAKFCCDLKRFPELGTIFRKTNSCGPIVREFEPSSYQT